MRPLLILNTIFQIGLGLITFVPGLFGLTNSFLQPLIGSYALALGVLSYWTYRMTDIDRIRQNLQLFFLFYGASTLIWVSSLLREPITPNIITYTFIYGSFALAFAMALRQLTKSKPRR